MRLHDPRLDSDVVVTHVYVDGTAGASVRGGSTGMAAAGFCVFHEYADGTSGFHGFDGALVATSRDQSFYLGAEHNTNGTAELMATGMASLWMLQSGFKNFCLGYDAVYAEKVARAISSPHTSMKLVETVAAIRESLELVATVFSMHVRSHRGDPWNELADVVCGSVSLREVGFTPAALPHGLC